MRIQPLRHARRRTHIAILVVLSLLMGVLTTAAVPAIVANRNFTQFFKNRRYNDSQIGVIPLSHQLASHLSSNIVRVDRRRALCSSECTVTAQPEIGFHGAMVRELKAAVPNWVCVPPGAQSIQKITTVAFGLPFRCASFCIVSPDLRGASIRDAVTVGSWKLPSRPLRFGLIANMIFWSLVWAALFRGLYFALGELTRRRRLARNLCPHCAYDIKNQSTPGCPECGWPRAAESLTTPPA